ncbi:hypothetical protein ACA910_013328 [Epithemia clementina (nom. ined.)]
MLAPRKTLWSTPDAVIDHVIQMKEFANLSSRDKICDIGCGDGRCLLQWAKTVSSSSSSSSSSCREQQNPSSQEEQPPYDDGSLQCPSFLGIDIDATRIQEAQAALQKARRQGDIDPHVNVSFHCANALECPELFHDATIVFLYLIPRGLRLLKPLLILPPTTTTSTLTAPQQEEQQPQQLTLTTRRQVVTYMAPLPQETPVRVEKIPVPHQPMAAWPVYLYTFSSLCRGETKQRRDSGGTDQTWAARNENMHT